MRKNRSRSMRIFQHLNVRLFLLMAVCAILCCTCFRILMLRQTQFYEWLVRKGICGLDTDKIVAEISGRAKNIELNQVSDEQLMKELQFEQYDDGYTALYIYQGENRMFRCGIAPAVWDSFISKPFWYADLGYYRGADTIVDGIVFKDTTAALAIYSYQQSRLVLPYMVTALAISLLAFVPVVLYMRGKIRYVGRLKDEILNIAGGDMECKVTVKGRDEIGILADELDKMRLSLNENIKMEEEVRRANHELIRSISHDLRTPMTTMYGYLEIMKRNQCSEEQWQEYIRRCIQKMEEIRSLSDQMFEYAFVYGASEQEKMAELAIEELLEELAKNGQFLELNGYQVRYDMNGSGKITGSRMMFRRILNNLFSNIQKYGAEQVLISAAVEKGRFRIELMNQIRKQEGEIESNRIGLKSVQKMMDMQGGSVFMAEDEENFAVTLEFPLAD